MNQGVFHLGYGTGIRKLILALFCSLVIIVPAFSQTTDPSQPDQPFGFSVAEVKSIVNDVTAEPELKKLKLQNLLQKYHASRAASSPHGPELRDPGDINLPEEALKELQKTIDSRRKQTSENLSQPANSEFVAHNPLLAEAHLAIARILREQDQSFTALSHYLSSLKYRKLKMDNALWINPQRLTGENTATDEQSRQMTTEYIRLETTLREKTEQLQKLKQAAHVAEFQLMHGQETGNQNDKINSLRVLKEKNRTDIASAEKEIERLTNEFNNASTTFSKDAREYDSVSASILEEIADTILTVDTLLRDKSKIINDGNQHRTGYNYTRRQVWDVKGWNLTESRQAVVNFLEAAGDLDMQNARVFNKLLAQYQLAGDDARQLKTLHRLLEISSATGPNNAATGTSAEIIKEANPGVGKGPKSPRKKPEFPEPFKTLSTSEIHRLLGEIYLKTRNHTLSAEHYEKALELASPDQAGNLRNVLIQLHVSHTGNYPRAAELLRFEIKNLVKPAANSPGDNPGSIIADAEYWNRSMVLHHNLAKCHEKVLPELEELPVHPEVQNDFAAYDESLAIALNAHTEFEKLVTREIQNSREADKQYQDARLEHSRNQTDDSLVKLNAAADIRKTRQETLAALLRLRNAQPLREIFFSRAQWLEKNHNIAESLQVYSQAEKAGVAPAEARQEMSRIRHTYYLP